MNRRHRPWLALLPLLLLVALSVSVDLGRTVTLVDVDGQPVPGAYVTFHREGHRLSLTQVLRFQAGPRGVAVSDDLGRVDVSPFVDLHWPFPLQSTARFVIDLVYAPSLHNGVISVTGNASEMPGVATLSSSGLSIELEDLTTDPERWLQSLGNLRAVIRALDEERRMTGAAVSADTRVRTVEMSAGAVAEYEAFQRRYRTVTRPTAKPPRSLQSASEAEPSQWRRLADQDLAKEPTWGDVAQRLHGTASP